jgi:hypothetical protein
MGAYKLLKSGFMVFVIVNAQCQGILQQLSGQLPCDLHTITVLCFGDVVPHEHPNGQHISGESDTSVLAVLAIASEAEASSLGFPFRAHVFQLTAAQGGWGMGYCSAPHVLY